MKVQCKNCKARGHKFYTHGKGSKPKNTLKHNIKCKSHNNSKKVQKLKNV